VREIESTGKLSLGNFWAARIRRIFPASFVVIAATAGAVVWIGSPELLTNIWRHVLASAFSGENILLALDQSDYFLSAEAPSPLRHLWSLAVEEQFYIVWPLLVGILVAVVGKFSQTVRALTFLIVFIVAASATYAVVLTVVNDPGAYFNSLARAWEIGLGAFVAMVGVRATRRLSTAAATAINRVAWVLLIATFFIPGLQAGVPSWGVAPTVILTAVVIATGNRRPATANNIVARTVRGVGGWVGDRSFSLYLWHWPILILAPYVIKGDLTTIDKVFALALAFLLSAVLHRFVSTPVRRSRRPILRNPFFVASFAFVTSAALAASVMVIAVAPTPSPLVPFDPSTASDPQSSFFDDTRVMRKGLDVTGIARYCDGAGAWLFDCDNETDLPRAPAAETTDPCERINPCEIGDLASPITVAFVGDSHALALKDAMDLVGQLLDWRIVSFTKSSCHLGEDTDPDCGVRNAHVMKRVSAGEFDLVIAAQRGEVSTDANYSTVFDAILKSGTAVAVFRDNPELGEATLSCQRINFSDPNVCPFTPSFAFRNDDHAVNAAASLGLHIIDLSTVFCHDNACPLAIGGMNVYENNHHVDRYFNETLAPLIAADLAGARLIRTE
jgi:peptidoglycan/LPS O-acetylase OafA/YrhL